MANTKSHLTSTLKKATIELLLLKLLDEADMYGYQLSQELKKRSNEKYTILEGSMYPILYRILESGHISSYEEKVGVRQTRIYYHLESSGKAYLQSQLQLYDEYIKVINYLLQSKEGDCYGVNAPEAAIQDNTYTADRQNLQKHNLEST